MVFVIVLGIPVLVLAIYAYGRWMYGEKWYLALGKNSTYGADDPTSQEMDDAEITRLNLDPREPRR